MLPIRTDLSVENSQTVGFGSLDIHLPTISGEGLPQPAIAHSKTAIVVVANWNLYLAKLNGMTTGFSWARAQSAECAIEAFVSIPKVVSGITPRPSVIYLPTYWRREAKTAVLSRKLIVDRYALPQRIALSVKIRETALRKAFSVLGLSISRETRIHSAGVASNNE